MIAEKIKMLREANNMTQSQLAKRLGITRSSVNAWEMGISSPSTAYLVELSEMFKVSTDYLLDLQGNHTINIDGLTKREIEIVYDLINHFKSSKKENSSL